MTFSYRISPRIPPEFRFHVFRIRFPRTLFSALTFPPILGGSPPLLPLFPRFPPQERRTSDVAVTNYLGLHQRDGEKERERSPPRPPLVDPSPPLAASPRGISPLLLHSPPPLLYFSPRLGISAEPNGTLIWTSSPAFVLPLRVYRYTRGHCFAPVRPNSRRGLAHRPY